MCERRDLPSDLSPESAQRVKDGDLFSGETITAGPVCDNESKATARRPCCSAARARWARVGNY